VKVIDIRNFKEPVLRLENNSVYSHSINTMTFLSDVEIGMGGSDGFITVLIDMLFISLFFNAFQDIIDVCILCLLDLPQMDDV
jgi:hypothetical protein